LTDEAVPVHLDTVLFQQVLINIVKNAVESIGTTQGLVTLEVTTPATLTITDNGHGIPPAIAKNLFTPFFSTKPQGQGLGLLLIRDILTSHHCTFNLLTDPEDHLTRFTIQFPIQKTQK
jgi:signal transduction histidine kinase